MKYVLLLFSLIILMPFSLVNGIELKPTPLETEFTNHISIFASQNDFGGLNDKNNSQLSTHKVKKNVSMGKAILYSALVPGWGEYYVGHHNKAKYFFAAEVLTWVGFISYRTYGSWKKQDFIRFASERANAKLDGRDDAFLDLVGFYSDIDQYNTLGRVSDPERPYLFDTPENHWHWQNEKDRASYRTLKNRSREAYRRANFMIGLAIVNRLISMIDAAHDARRSRTKIDTFSRKKHFKYRFSLNPLSRYHQIKVSLLTPY